MSTAALRGDAVSMTTTSGDDMSSVGCRRLNWAAAVSGMTAPINCSWIS